MKDKYKFLKPIYYFYYVFSFIVIWFLAFLDDVDTFGDDAVHHVCDVISDENTESMRDVTVPFSFLLITPFIFHFANALRKRRDFRGLLPAGVIIVVWFWLFFGEYIKCY